LEAVEGEVNILDFKTGVAPTRAQVVSGFAPQLTLTAAIVAAGGFTEVGKAAPGQLSYVRLTGRNDGGSEDRVDRGDAPELARLAQEGLDEWIARYDEPTQAYPSRIALQFISSPSDYDHLARLSEWSSGASDGGDE
jgi:ATP-dependent helicase/nuclease subunit B